jgi:hypothetical protein
MEDNTLNCMMTDLPVTITGDAKSLDAGDDRLLVVHRGVVVGVVHTGGVHGSKTIRMVMTREHPEQPFKSQQAQTIEWFR